MGDIEVMQRALAGFEFNVDRGVLMDISLQRLAAAQHIAVVLNFAVRRRWPTVRTRDHLHASVLDHRISQCYPGGQ